MAACTVFFIQKSPALAGSQKSLLRLMQALDERWIPVLIAGAEGWLTSEARSAGIPVVVRSFPSSRSLKARLIGNRLFAQAVAGECISYRGNSCLVHGNDHIQSLCTLAVAKALNAPSLLTLRSSGMNRRDFFKYGCHRHNQVVANGHELHKKVCSWCSDPQPRLIENGVDEKELNPNPVFATAVPSSVLVLGSMELCKGWRDLADALVLLEEQGRGRNIEFALLGNDYGLAVDEVVGADRLKTFRLKHLPLTPDFEKTVGEFKFAIHPSRSESFGMALLEVLAAGVPVLTSRTGVADRVVTDERFLFEPEDPASLAGKLGSLMRDFSGAEQMVRQAQQTVLSRYCVSRTAADYMDLYSNIIGQT